MKEKHISELGKLEKCHGKKIQIYYTKPRRGGYVVAKEGGIFRKMKNIALSRKVSHWSSRDDGKTRHEF